jgi:hypothetical protein
LPPTRPSVPRTDSTPASRISSDPTSAMFTNRHTKKDPDAEVEKTVVVTGSRQPPWALTAS